MQAAQRLVELFQQDSQRIQNTGRGAANALRELTGQRRNRVFVYDDYLNILNEGGDAL